MHDEFPTRPEHWAKHLEGSYADREQLRTLDGLGHNWLYIDHGWREMQWATHCNTEVVRWTLRRVRRHAGRAGSTVSGRRGTGRGAARPDAARRRHPTAGAGDLELARSRMGQRYAVTTLCRMLYTLDTAMVCSKLPANSVQGWQVADGTLYASDISLAGSAAACGMVTRRCVTRWTPQLRRSSPATEDAGGDAGRDPREQ